jgi:hypothetical protein
MSKCTIIGISLVTFIRMNELSDIGTIFVSMKDRDIDLFHEEKK